MNAPARPNDYTAYPDASGRFGDYGGRYVPETLMPLVHELDAAYKAAKADPDKTVNVTLDTDAGKSKPSRSGGYYGGVYERLWAGWGAGAPSAPVFDLLKRAKIVYVVADGERHGPFDMQIKSLPYNSLNGCAERVRKGQR